MSQPSYESLVSLNPLLRDKPRERVEWLLSTMEAFGLVWDEHDRCFVHPPTGIAVRTQGLDMFVDNPAAWVISFHEAETRLKGSGAQTVTLTYRADPLYVPTIEQRIKETAHFFEVSANVRWSDGGPHTVMQAMEATITGPPTAVSRASDAIKAILREADRLPGQGLKGRLGEWLLTRVLGMRPPKP